MKRIIQFAVLSLCLSGLAFAANNPAPASTNRDSNTTGNNSNRIDSNSPIKNTDIRDGSIAPSGSGTTQNGTGSLSTTGSTQIKGTVESVDQSGNRVRVRDSQGNIQDFNINDKTEFMNSQKKAKFSDLKSGDPVTLDFNIDNQSVQKFDIGRRKQTLKK